MQKQWTNIACITGLLTIFIIAAICPANFTWVAGVVVMLLIFTIRNWLGEVSRKTEIVMAVSSGFCTLITVVFLFMYR
jgi:hypothetical protein